MQLTMPEIVGSYIPENTHILQQECIHSNTVQLANHLQRILHLIFIDDGIHRHVNLGTKLMGIITEFLDILERVTGSGAGSKTGSTNIHCIGTMVDSSNSTLQILGWSKKFQLSQMYLLFLFCFNIIHFLSNLSSFYNSNPTEYHQYYMEFPDKRNS